MFFLLFGLLALTIGQILINKYLDTYIIHIGYDPATLGHYTLLTGLIGALSNIALIPLIKRIREKHLPFFSAPLSSFPPSRRLLPSRSPSISCTFFSLPTFSISS